MADRILKGGCLCGAVRFEATGEPMMAAHCHCLDCRKAAAAGHTTIAVYAKDAVKITGTLKTYRSKADSGMMANRSFCPECGSWISGWPDRMPGVVALSLATFDDPEAVVPQMRFYDKRRLSWDTVDPALPSYPELMPMPQGPA